jgi:hypothetical protein
MSRPMDTEEAAKEALQRIYNIMDGKEWSPDTCQEIAEVLREYGFVVADLEQMIAQDERKKEGDTGWLPNSKR